MANTALLTEMLVNKITEIPDIGKNGALLTNPGSAARFPCCVVQPPLQRPEYHGGAWLLSVTAEAWAERRYEAMRISDLVKCKLLELNFTLTGNTPLFQDPVTEKWRFGGTYEARWNAITNELEFSR